MLKPVVLRRTKGMTDVDGRAIVNLPPKTIVNVNVQLSDAELAFYNVRPLHRVSPYPCLTPLCVYFQALYTRSKLEFDGLVASGNARKRMTAIWTLLLRLRQTCDHPFLALGRPDSKKASLDDDASDASAGAGAGAGIGADGDGGEEKGVEGADNDLQKVLHSSEAETGKGLDAASIRRLYKELIARAGPKTPSRQRKSADGGDGEMRLNEFAKKILSQLRTSGMEGLECPMCLDEEMLCARARGVGIVSIGNM